MFAEPWEGIDVTFRRLLYTYSNISKFSIDIIQNTLDSEIFQQRLQSCRLNWSLFWHRTRHLLKFEATKKCSKTLHSAFQNLIYITSAEIVLTTFAPKEIKAIDRTGTTNLFNCIHFETRSSSFLSQNNFRKCAATYLMARLSILLPFG